MIQKKRKEIYTLVKMPTFLKIYSKNSFYFWSDFPKIILQYCTTGVPEGELYTSYSEFLKFFSYPQDGQWQHPFHMWAGNVSVWGNICLILWAVATLLIQIWFLSFQDKWSPQANTLCCRSSKWINTAFHYTIPASSQLFNLIHSFIGVFLVTA